MPVAHSDDGVRISYESFGNGSLPLVLLHGWGGSASYWREMVSRLDLAGLRVIALSYRGHGDSDKACNGLQPRPASAGRVGRCRCRWRTEVCARWIQHDRQVCTIHSRSSPPACIGLVLIARVPATEFSVPSEVGKAWCDAQHDRNAAFDQILTPFIKIPVKAELTEAFLDDFQKAARVGLEQTLEMCAVSFAEQARHIGVPTLVLAGTYDSLMPPDLSVEHSFVPHFRRKADRFALRARDST